MCRGYTIIEMAIAIGIVGLIVGVFIVSSSSLVRSEQYISTEKKLDTIEKAISRYLHDKGHLPCVASRSDAPDNANFGREIDCSNTAIPAGTVRVQNPDTTEFIRIGALPVKELSLPARCNYMYYIF